MSFDNSEKIQRRARILELLNKKGRSEMENEFIYEFLQRVAYPQMHKYINVPKDEWEAIVVDSIHEMLSKCDGSKEMTSASIYFSKILYTKTMDYLKRERREKAIKRGDNTGLVSQGRQDRNENEIKDDTGEGLRRVPFTNNMGAEYFVGDIENKDLIVKAVAILRSRLGESYAKVLELRIIEGYSANDVAKILQISPANVDTILSRARKFLVLLRKELSGEGQ